MQEAAFAPAKTLPRIPEPRTTQRKLGVEWITVRDLPQGNITNWTATLRWIVAMAVKKNLLTMEQALGRYKNLAQSDIERWIHAVDSGQLLPEMTKLAG